MPVAEISCPAVSSALKVRMTTERDLPPATGEFAPATPGSKRLVKSRKSKALTKRSSKLRLGGKSAEIRNYLTKLQDLVPFVPKDRKLSKLEVIEGVIDYICHLQGALQTHPAVMAAADGLPLVSDCPVAYCQQRASLSKMDCESRENFMDSASLRSEDEDQRCPSSLSIDA